MATARDLITSSLRLLNAVATGEPPSADESTDGLSALNQMLDSWSTENLIIPSTVREVFAFTSGKGSYTMGTGGDFNTTRPLEIEQVLVQLAGTSPLIEMPIEILNEEQYASLAAKDLQTPIARSVYADGAYPLQTLSFYPVPTANSVVIYSQKPLSSIATLDTVVDLNPGYYRALRFNLAVELAPEYGRPVSQDIAMVAMDAKANIKRQNIKTYYMQAETALLPKRGGFNWFTGEPK